MAWIGAVRNLQRVSTLASPGLDRSAQALLQLKFNPVLQRRWTSLTPNRARVFDGQSTQDNEDVETEDLSKLSQQTGEPEEDQIFMPESVSHCDSCQAPRENVVCHCEVCDEFLCSVCDQTKHGLSLNSLLSPGSSPFGGFGASSKYDDEAPDHQRTYYDRATVLKQEELEEVNKFFKDSSVTTAQKKPLLEGSPLDAEEDADYREIRDFLYPALSVSSATSTPVSTIPSTANLPSSPVPSSLATGFAIPATPVRHSIGMPLMEKLSPIIVSPFSDHAFVGVSLGAPTNPADRMMLPQSPPDVISNASTYSRPRRQQRDTRASRQQRRRASVSFPTNTATPTVTMQTTPSSSANSSPSTTSRSSPRSNNSSPLSPFLNENDSYEQMVQYEKAYQAAYDLKASSPNVPVTLAPPVSTPVVPNPPAAQSYATQPQPHHSHRQSPVVNKSASRASTPTSYTRPPPHTPTFPRPPPVTHMSAASSAASRPQGRPANKSRPVRQPVQSSSGIPQISEERFRELQAATIRPKQPRGRPPKNRQLQQQQQLLQHQQIIQQQQQQQQQLPSAFSALSIRSAASPELTGNLPNVLTPSLASTTAGNKVRKQRRNRKRNDDEMSQSDSDVEVVADDLTSNAAQSIARNLVTWRDSFQLVDEEISNKISQPTTDPLSREREYPSRSRPHAPSRYHRRDQSASPRASIVAAPAIIHPASLSESNPFATLLVLCSDSSNNSTSANAAPAASSMSSVTTAFGQHLTALDVSSTSGGAESSAAMQSVMEGAIEAATMTTNGLHNDYTTSSVTGSSYPAFSPYSISATSTAPIISTSSFGDASYNFVTQFAYPYTTAPDFSPINNIMQDATVPEFYEQPTPANTNPSYFIV